MTWHPLLDRLRAGVAKLLYVNDEHQPLEEVNEPKAAREREAARRRVLSGICRSMPHPTEAERAGPGGGTLHATVAATSGEDAIWRPWRTSPCTCTKGGCPGHDLRVANDTAQPRLKKARRAIHRAKVKKMSGRPLQLVGPARGYSTTVGAFEGGSRQRRALCNTAERPGLCAYEIKGY